MVKIGDDTISFEWSYPQVELIVVFNNVCNQQSKLLYPKGTLEDAIPYRMMGIAGRATYSWKDRYFAEFNIGYNGAENFS